MAAATAMLLRSSDATALHSLAANYDRAVRNPLALAGDGPPPEIVQLWREQRSPASSSEWHAPAPAPRPQKRTRATPREVTDGIGTRPLAPGAGVRPTTPALPAAPNKPDAGLGVLAATVGPAILRNLVFGGGAGAPGSSLETADSKALIPGRWLGYGEDISGYEEERQGGDYLKSLQNTKPLPMWWRYNGKTPPPWFQPNEPLARGHLLRSSVPIPAPPFKSPFNPGWMRSKNPKPPQPAEFPSKHPMAMPWNGEGMMQCPCPGNPSLMCDCLSIQYPVELPIPQVDGFRKLMSIDAKFMMAFRTLMRLLLQPPLLEVLTALAFGSTGLVPGSFPNKLIMGTMAWFGLSLLTMLMFGGGAMGE